MPIDQPIGPKPLTPSPKPLPKRPTPPPIPTKQEDVKIQDVREQMTEPQISLSKKSTLKASLNIGKSGRKLQKNIKKFFKPPFENKQKRLNIDPRIKLDELKSRGVHENLNLEDANNLLHAAKGLTNKALIRTENGELYITRLNYVTKGGLLEPEYSDDQIDNKTFTEDEIALINRWSQKTHSGYIWLSPTSQRT